MEVATVFAATAGVAAEHGTHVIKYVFFLLDL